MKKYLIVVCLFSLNVQASRLLKVVKVAGLIGVPAVFVGAGYEELERTKRDLNKLPLHAVMKNNFAWRAEYYINSGADVTVTDHEGNTALHLLSYISNISHQIRIAMFCLAQGADVNATNMAGNTPLHIAVSIGNPELVRLLIASEAKQIQNSEDLTPLDMVNRRIKYETSKSRSASALSIAMLKALDGKESYYVAPSNKDITSKVVNSTVEKLTSDFRALPVSSKTAVRKIGTWLTSREGRKEFEAPVSRSEQPVIHETPPAQKPPVEEVKEPVLDNLQLIEESFPPVLEANEEPDAPSENEFQNIAQDEESSSKSAGEVADEDSDSF